MLTADPADRLLPILLVQEAVAHVVREPGRILVTEPGRLFIRNIAMTFDAHLGNAKERYSKTV